MRRLRRLLLVPLAAVPAIAAVAHGCSTSGFESICGWLEEPNNCLREFHQDMLAHANVGSADNPNGDCRFLTFDGGAPTEATPTSPGVANGAFPVPPSMRGMLATCVMDVGGSVTIDPPIDPTMWPQSPNMDGGLPTYVLTFVNADSTTCGTASFTSPYNFSISVNPVPSADGGGTGGTGTGGSAPADAGYGTFTEVNPQGRDAVTVTCPSGEAHLLNLDEINGTNRCPEFGGIVPQALLQVFPGGVDVPGAVSFAIVYPPLDAGAPYPDGGPPLAADRVVYFNCKIPKAPETCHDTVKDGFETDIDCGGPQIASKSACGTCPARCQVMQQCLCNADCGPGLVCANNPMSGMLQCVDADAGVADFPTCSWDNTPVACDDGGAGTSGGGTGGGGTGGSSSSADAGDGG